MLEFVLENKGWLFSGIGIAAFLGLIRLFISIIRYSKSKSKEKSDNIVRNIEFKEKMQNDFLTKRIDINDAIKNPWKRFRSLDIMLRSKDDNTYPKQDDPKRKWYKVEVHDFYYNGLEVALNIIYVIIDDNGYWDELEHEEKYDEGKYYKGKAYVNGRIPFTCIIDYDLYGDEYFRYPQIFCDFKYNGTPYEEIVYLLLGEKYNEHLENDKRKKLKRF